MQTRKMSIQQHRFSTLKELHKFVLNLETEQKTKFVKQTSSKGFQDIDESGDWRHSCKGKLIQWKSKRTCKSYEMPFDGKPYIMLAFRYLECKYGPKRCTCMRCMKEKSGKVDDDHTYSNCKHTNIQTSRKLECPAKIVIHRIVKFNDFSISKDSQWQRRMATDKLKNALDDSSHTFSTEFFYILSFPSVEEHQNHYIGPMAETSLDVDDRVMSKMKGLFDEGVRKVGEMQRRIRDYVTSEIFQGNNTPLQSDGRFCPSRKAIQNCLYRCQVKARLADEDLENLLQNIPQWQKGDDNFYVDATGSTNSAICVYQSRWQMEMLSKYGSEVCLIDSTFKTTRYNLPLLVVAVVTGLGYFPVATAIVPSEKKDTILSALKVLAEWNPLWKPRYVMSDFHEGQFQAIQQIFPESMLLICDFHRIQAWKRRFARHKHKKEILSMLESIARSDTEDDCASALQEFYTSPAFLNDSKLSKWFEKKWLPKYK